MQKVNYILVILLLIVVPACSKNGESPETFEFPDGTGDILVSFNNQTGKSIYSVVANDLALGTLGKDVKTKHIAFESFGIDTGMPDISFTGKINGKELRSSNRFYWCGTEKSALKPGKYDIVIKIVSIDNVDYFNLQFECK